MLHLGVGVSTQLEGLAGRGYVHSSKDGSKPRDAAALPALCPLLLVLLGFLPPLSPALPVSSLTPSSSSLTPLGPPSETQLNPRPCHAPSSTVPPPLR